MPSWNWSYCEFKTNPQKVNDANEYMKDHIFELWGKIWRHNWSLQLYTELMQLWNSKAWKNSGLNRIGTNYLCDTCALLYHANWAIKPSGSMLVLWVRNIPVQGEECKWIYERLTGRRTYFTLVADRFTDLQKNKISSKFEDRKSNICIFNIL